LGDAVLCGPSREGGGGVSSQLLSDWSAAMVSACSLHASVRDCSEHFTGPCWIDGGECFTERLIALACRPFHPTLDRSTAGSASPATLPICAGSIDGEERFTGHPCHPTGPRLGVAPLLASARRPSMGRLLKALVWFW
jgi:hypothetical protein